LDRRIGINNKVIYSRSREKYYAACVDGVGDGDDEGGGGGGGGGGVQVSEGRGLFASSLPPPSALLRRLEKNRLFRRVA